jgi:RecA-family ATPase
MSKKNKFQNDVVAESIPHINTSKQLLLPDFPGAANQFNPANFPNNPLANFIGVHDWHLIKPSPPRWIIHELLHEDTVNLIDGLGSSGKSILALQLAICISAGLSWLGFATCLSGPVIYLNGEDPKDENHRRYLRILNKMLLNQVQLERLQNNLSFISMPDASIDTSLIDAKGERTATYSHLVEILNAIKPLLVIIDPLVYFSDANENDNNMAKQLYKALRALNACVLVVHHQSKSAMNGESSQRAKSRGASVYTENARTRMSLEAGILTVDKNNYGKIFEGGDAIQLTMEAGVWRPRTLTEKIAVNQPAKTKNVRRKSC